MKIPSPDYLRPGSFGSLELQKRETTEFIGQPVDYSPANLVEVPTASIDSLAVPRIDMMKIDVEGMELEVLEGAAQSIARHKPVLMVEWVKSDKTKLASWLTIVLIWGVRERDELPGDPQDRSMFGAHGKSGIVDDNLSCAGEPQFIVRCSGGR